MNEYIASFSMPIYGEAIIKAETQKQACNIAKDIAHYREMAWIDWQMDNWRGDPMTVDEVAFIKEIKEKPEQTDEEWFDEWQEEMYD